MNAPPTHPPPTGAPLECTGLIVVVGQADFGGLSRAASLPAFWGWSCGLAQPPAIGGPAARSSYPANAARPPRCSLPGALLKSLLRRRESIRRIGASHAVADHEIELPSGTVRKGGSEVSNYPPAEKSKWCNTAALDVRLLGTVDFESALFLQERLVYEISGRGDLFGGLFLCEHPPLITVGRARQPGSHPRRTKGADGFASGRPLAESGRRVPRCTHRDSWPSIRRCPLDRLGLGLREYRRALIGSVLDVCRELGVPAWPVEQAAGVAGRGGSIRIRRCRRQTVGGLSGTVSERASVRWDAAVRHSGGERTEIDLAGIGPRPRDPDGRRSARA